MSELGTAIRTWRARTDPADVGLAQGPRRRTAGLRREELAMLAGISTDYVTRLEQGRAATPSRQVVAALARALRLEDTERRLLHTLAGQAVALPGRMPREVTPSVQRLVDQLEANPVGVLDAAGNLLSWNSLWAGLMGDPSGFRGHARNTVWRHFSGEPSPVSHSAEQLAAYRAGCVGDLRAAQARYPNDPDLRSLISDLQQTSEEFAAMWAGATGGQHSMHSKRIMHPAVGELLLDCDVLAVNGGDIKIVVYTAAPGSEAAEKLRLVGVIGTQQLV